jgi:hypothetical protein
MVNPPWADNSIQYGGYGIVVITPLCGSGNTGSIPVSRPKKYMKIWKWLIYITNNEDVSRHEQVFDVAFFIINTIALVLGIYFFIYYQEPQWIAVLVIEYTWALDNMRHNRP